MTSVDRCLLGTQADCEREKVDRYVLEHRQTLTERKLTGVCLEGRKLTGVCLEHGQTVTEKKLTGVCLEQRT